MILPKKHIKVSESLLGLGSMIIDLTNVPKTFDELWDDFQKVNNTEKLPSHHSLDNFLMALTFLFIIGAVREEEGVIVICS